MTENFEPFNYQSLLFTYTRFTRLEYINRCTGILNCIRDKSKEEESKKEVLLKAPATKL